MLHFLIVAFVTQIYSDNYRKNKLDLFSLHHYFALETIVFAVCFVILDLCQDCLSLQISFLVEIGIGVTGFGVFFLFIGVIFFFDKGLLAIGNVRY